MRIIVSAPACAPHLGSEALVGYRTVEALAKHFEVEVITSAGMSAPTGIPTQILPVRFDDPNDVGTAQLLRFELLQRQKLKHAPPHLIYRLTPSGQKPSLIPHSSAPLIIGPILLSTPPPPAFDAIFRPALPPSRSPRSILKRIGHGLSRRIFDRFSTLDTLLNSATTIIVGTRLTQLQLPPQLHARTRLLTYAGVEHDLFTPATRQHTTTPHLLFVGRLVPYKGIELLLRAAALAKTRCSFRLTVVGQGVTPYTSYCHNLVRELKLAETVSFLPNQPRAELPALYRSADIFCMPSIETYGLAILEAMSCGCVPLVSDFNGPGEIVAPHTGVKVPLQSPEQFITEYAAAITALVEDRPLREQLGQQAREHIIRHHDWNQINSSLLEIFEAIAETHQT